MGIINSNLSACGLVEKYVGTAYDVVKSVADDIDNIDAVAEIINDGRLDEVLALGDDITLAALLINFKGAWDNVTNYVIGDSVSHLDAIWISNAANLNSEPGAGNSDWLLIVESNVVSLGVLSELPAEDITIKTAFVTGHTTPNDGGGGTFHYDANYDRLLADGGTIIDASGTGTGVGCWLREYPKGHIQLEWFGGFADTPDVSTIFQYVIDNFIGVIHLGIGTYNANIIIKSDTWLAGVGMNTTKIKAVVDAHTIQSNPSDFCVRWGLRDLTVVGNLGYTGKDTINIRAPFASGESRWAANISFHNVTCETAGRNGIRLEGHSEGVSNSFVQLFVATGVITTNNTNEEGFIIIGYVLECYIESIMIKDAGRLSGKGCYIGYDDAAETLPTNNVINTMTVSIHNFTGTNGVCLRIKGTRDLVITKVSIEVNQGDRTTQLMSVEHSATRNVRIHGNFQWGALYTDGELVDRGPDVIFNINRAEGFILSGYAHGSAPAGLLLQLGTIPGTLTGFDANNLIIGNVDQTVTAGTFLTLLDSSGGGDIPHIDHLHANRLDVNDTQLLSFGDGIPGRIYTIAAAGGNSTNDFILDGTTFILQQAQWRPKEEETITLRAAEKGDGELIYYEIARSHPVHWLSAEPTNGYWYIGERVNKKHWVGTGVQGWVCSTEGVAGAGAVFTQIQTP